MAVVRLQKKPIEVAKLYQLLKHPSYGAIAVFCGTVREWTGIEHTDFIEYTAYEEMAKKELASLARVVEADGNHVVIVHRLGHLAVGEEAIFVGVASPHRTQAFKACQSLMNTIKKTVPIWKKEKDDTDNLLRWGR